MIGGGAGGDAMTYESWEKEVAPSFVGEPLWKVTAYRKSLFLGDLAWSDVTRLIGDRRVVSLADQLYRAVGSVGANIAEGYSRSSKKDQVRFYEYALGSARESRDWYFKARHILGQTVFNHRCELLTQIIRLLLTTIPQQRNLGK
ncbi:MAG TPA: four helix bundle protein [Humisphaera sp.]|jgi:four helix bundle protein|nr:four helix bundle protein [Humisphaera sp.]